MTLPVDGLLIMAATVVTIFTAVFLFWLVDRWSRAARDALRSRLGSPNWKPSSIDLLYVPAWLALEIFCFAVVVLCTLIMLWGTYQAAKGARDWWHAGNGR